MTQTTEAVYSNGVLKPTGDLHLREQQRVRLIVESLDEAAEDRQQAVNRLRAGIESMQFFSSGRLPTREELHDRTWDVVVKAQPPHAPTRSTIRRRDSRSTSAERLILEGKVKGPRSGATINEPQHCLGASAPLHHLRSTTNQQQAVRCQDGWSSRLVFYCGLRTHPRDRTLLGPSPHLSPTSIRPARRRPGRRHRRSFLRWSP